MTEIKNPGMIEVLLNLSRYQPALGNERINTFICIFELRFSSIKMPRNLKLVDYFMAILFILII